MSDVRLTATNPEDSSAVPVACNSKGELLLEEIPDQSFDGDLDGDLTVSGSATFGNYSDNNGLLINGLGGGVANLTINRASGSSGLIYGQLNGNTTSLINADGSVMFSGGAISIESGGTIRTAAAGTGMSVGTALSTSDTANSAFEIKAGATAGTPDTGQRTVKITPSGSAEFTGDVSVGSRSKKWTLVEQGGLCHMVEVTLRSPVSTADLVDEPDDIPKYPKLRDVFHELDLIEQALQQVMEKLRLDPPAGWPVGDGSDKRSATE